MKKKTKKRIFEFLLAEFLTPERPFSERTPIDIDRIFAVKRKMNEIDQAIDKHEQKKLQREIDKIDQELKKSEEDIQRNVVLSQGESFSP